MNEAQKAQIRRVLGQVPGKVDLEEPPDQNTVTFTADVGRPGETLECVFTGRGADVSVEWFRKKEFFSLVRESRGVEQPSPAMTDDQIEKLVRDKVAQFAKERG